jgi:hypothetical protein
VRSAAAKAGKSVLHLDHEEFYGSQARCVRTSVRRLLTAAHAPCASALMLSRPCSLAAPLPTREQWAAFGAPALRQWVAAGDAAVLAATEPPLPPAAAEAAVSDGEVCVPVRAAAAQRRRYGAFSFVGPDAAPDAPPSVLRGCSIDLAGPKARWLRTSTSQRRCESADRRVSLPTVAATGGLLRRRAG